MERAKKTEFMRLIASLLLLVSPAIAGDWSRFRGPHGSGVAEGCQPPVKLGKDCEAWRVPVPPGLSSPVLSRHRVFLTAEKDGELLTIAFDKKNGKELWRRAAPAKANEKVHRAASQASRGRSGHAEARNGLHDSALGGREPHPL